MTNQNSTLADRATAAHTELRTAEHRIAKLEGIEAELGKNILNLKNNLLFIGDTDAQARQQVEKMLEPALAELNASKVERVELRSRLVTLHQTAAGYAHLSRATGPANTLRDMEAARDAWVEAITPHLALAERLRVAMKCVGKASFALAESELLSFSRQP
jgi:hypothetical protein